MKPQFPSFTAPAAPERTGVGVAFRALCAQLNDCFTALHGYLRHTAKVDYVTVASPATADEPFRVSHGLGETPLFVSAIMEAAGGIYATAADRSEWATTYVKIRCPVANCRMIVKVEA